MDHGKIIALDTPDRLKGKVGGDVLELVTDDNKAAMDEIMAAYGLETKESGKIITLNVQKGNEFLVNFVKELSTPIRSINLRRPTLNDVFLNMTGREIRDTEQKQNGFKRKGRHGGPMRRH
jgi:ABC-2 type transport system ATP-binding protein